MTSQEIKSVNTQNKEIVANIVLAGDVSRLSAEQKVQYYNQFCMSLNLNPLTRPFQLIKFQGKEQLYATKDCTEQLRNINGISITSADTQLLGDIYIVKCFVKNKNDRQDFATGCVSVKGLSGEQLANAMMKAETKSKRRATLSICGLGILDESETDSVGSYQKVDIETGEIFDSKVVKEEKQPVIYNSVNIEMKNQGECEAGDYVIKTGKNAGKSIKELPMKTLKFFVDNAQKEGKTNAFIEKVQEYINFIDSCSKNTASTLKAAIQEPTFDNNQDIPF